MSAVCRFPWGRNQFLLFPNSLFLIRLSSDSACGLHSLQSSFDPLWT